MFKRKAFYLFLMLTVFSLILASCGNTTEKEQEDVKKEPVETSNYSSEVKENPIVTITLENDEKVIVELDPTVAPNTVANFISLIEDGYYDGLIFHRVIPDFMIQGGDSAGNGTGGPGYSIDGEFTANGFENNLLHERGVISMARAQDPNSAGSQFFIMVADTPQLDGDYAAFGKVTDGMDAVDAIVATERDAENKPVQEQKMKKVEVDTKGFDYPAPVVNK